MIFDIEREHYFYDVVIYDKGVRIPNPDAPIEQEFACKEDYLEYKIFPPGNVSVENDLPGHGDLSHQSSSYRKSFC